MLKVFNARQFTDKVQREVEFLQRLTSFQILDFFDVIYCKVDILKLFQSLKIFWMNENEKKEKKSVKISLRANQIELLPIFGIKLDCRRRIFSSRHQFWIYSIFSIFSWCSESSSRLKMSNSLCSDFFRMSFSVTAINQCKNGKNVALEENAGNEI